MLINKEIESYEKVNKYGLLTKCEVKMAGYWPSSSFACLWTETKSRSINAQNKKKTRPISSHLDRTNLVNKGFIIWLSLKFFLRDTAGSPERARWLARSGSQSHRAIWFTLPARGAYHIIKWKKEQVGKEREKKSGVIRFNRYFLLLLLLSILFLIYLYL